ncbi:MAG: hypothetical protein MJZ68_07110 [archaeon]|nr:hypothetical protein [archaeon]
MAKKTKDKIAEILDTLDNEDLLNVIHILQEKVGDRIILEALETVSDDKCGFDPGEVMERAAKCLDMDEREWSMIACTNDYGRYIDPGEHASEVISENLKKEFGNMLKTILLAGDTESAADLLYTIADGLEGSYGTLAEECPDSVEELIDHLVECADEGKFDRPFR